AQRVHEQPQITGVADDSIDAVCDQSVPGLDCDQPAEAIAKHKDRPDPQRATSREENDAKAADGIAIERPELLPVRPGRQKGGDQPDQRKGYYDPAVAAVLPHP